MWDYFTVCVCELRDQCGLAVLEDDTISLWYQMKQMAVCFIWESLWSHDGCHLCVSDASISPSNTSEPLRTTALRWLWQGTISDIHRLIFTCTIDLQGFPLTGFQDLTVPACNLHLHLADAFIQSDLQCIHILLLHWWHTAHQEQLGVECLAQGRFDRESN